MELLSAAEAAGKLGVSVRQVRRLAAAGELSGRRVGDRWLIDAEAVRARGRGLHQAGRPLSARMAWAVLAGAGAGLDGAQPVALDSSALLALLHDRQSRHRFRMLLGKPPGAECWDQWLRNRARRRRVWVHPGVLERLAEDPRLHPVDRSAVAQLGVGVASGGSRRFYVKEEDVASVLKAYRARDDDDGQVDLMVVPFDVPDAALGPPGAPVSPAVALVDLLSSADARERRGAVSVLGATSRRLTAEVSGAG